MDIFKLPPTALNASLEAVYRRGIDDRKTGATTDSPYAPVREFESYLVYEFGWYSELSVGDFLSLSDRYALLAASLRRGRDSAAVANESLVIQRILGAAPWIRTRSGNAVLKTDIYVYTDAVALYVMQACERAVSKSRPISNLNLDSVKSNALAPYGFNLANDMVPTPAPSSQEPSPATV